MVQLKPCPFCGGEAELKKDSYYAGAVKVERVYCRCSNCGIATRIYGPSIDYCATDRVIKVWNTRVNDFKQEER